MGGSGLLDAEGVDAQILIPLLDDWESARRLLADLEVAAAAADQRYAVLLVDDGSSEACPFGAELAATLPRLRPLELATLAVNQGHARAIAVGLALLAERPGDAPLLVMDGDGEDRAQDVPRLVEAGRGQQRIVVAERRRRTERLGFRLFYGLYKLLFRLLTGRRISFGNFCLIPAGVARRLVHRAELWSHLAGTLVAGRWPIKGLPTDRGRRYAGRSKMNLPTLVQHGLGAIAVDLDRVLARVLLLLSLVIAVLGLALAGIVAVRVLTDLAIPGWATTAFGLVAILFLQSVVFAFLLLFVSLRTRGLQSVVPARDWRDYLLETRRLDRDRER
jgi:hypothetical protein